MKRFRMVLMLALIAAGVVAAPGASASVVTNPAIEVYQGPGPAASQVTAGANGGIKVLFNTTSALGAGSTVTITGPVGTVFSNGLIGFNNNTMTNVTTAPGATSSVGATVISNGGRTITNQVPNGAAASAGDRVSVNLGIFQYFVNYGTSAGQKTMQVGTSQDTTPVETPQYTVVPDAAVTPIAVDGAQSTAFNQNFKPTRVGLEDQYGNAIAGQQVTATVAPSGASGSFPGPVNSVNVTTGANGEVQLPTVKANSVLGQWNLDLEGPGGLDSAYQMENLAFTDAASVIVALSPPSLEADGTSRSVATATVTDEFGNPVPGDSVSFGSSGSQLIGAVTDNGNGTYKADVTASTTSGQSTITATDSSPATPVSGSATLTQTATSAKSIELTLTPSSIPADGTSKTTVRAVVRDGNGNPIDNAQVQITATGGQAVAPVDSAGSGAYTAAVTSSKAAGSSEISATVVGVNPAVSAKTTLIQTAVVVTKPRLKFMKPPKKKVKSAKVKFRFKAVSGKAIGFQCRLDKKKWKKCKSPKVVKLKKGNHVFRVRGIASDGTFGKPIVRKVRRVG